MRYHTGKNFKCPFFNSFLLGRPITTNCAMFFFHKFSNHMVLVTGDFLHRYSSPRCLFKRVGSPYIHGADFPTNPTRLLVNV
jgi:hypothetical protein